MENQQRQCVKDIKENDNVDSIYLVKEKTPGTTKSGKTYLTVKLVDKTGEIECKVWDDVDAVSERFKKDDFVTVRGKASAYNGKMQLTATDISMVKDSAVKLSDFQPQSQRDGLEMLKELLEVINSVKNPHLKALLDSFFRDKELRMAYAKSPAAKGMHHVYLGGLIEHSLSIAKVADAVMPAYPMADRDIVVTGALLHDIGKIKELTCAKSFDYSDEGRLLGHIVIGHDLLVDRIRSIEGFPSDLALHMRHIILSHHGEYEYGSPKRPKTIEAEILNHLDDLDAKVNGIVSHMKDNTDPETGWSSFHRLYGRPFFGGKPAVADATIEPQSPFDR